VVQLLTKETIPELGLEVFSEILPDRIIIENIMPFLGTSIYLLQINLIYLKLCPMQM
jgi:hypothetical protein